MTTLGQRLHAARYAKGYKLRTVAQMTGISAATISRAERDVTWLTVAAAHRLADCYGVSVGSLLGEVTALTLTGQAGGTTMTTESIQYMHMTGRLRTVVRLLDVLAADLLRDGTVPERVTGDLLMRVAATIVNGDYSEAEDLLREEFGRKPRADHAQAQAVAATVAEDAADLDAIEGHMRRMRGDGGEWI